MAANKYLLVDIGDSGILYMVVTGNPIQSINNLARDIKTGSALALGNAESNYIFHKKDIIGRIQEKCDKFEVDTVCINIPSKYDNLALLPSTVKKATLLNEILKSDINFEDQTTVLVHGPLKRTSDTGSLVTAVSAVNKEYFDIVKEVTDAGLTVNVTTSFTRLQLLADDKVDLELVDDNFIVMDTGYSGTRAIIFDEVGTPTGMIKSTLSGRDIVENMQSNPLDADNNFMERKNLTDGVKSYINSNAFTTIKQIKAKTNNKPCKIFIYGGLSTLPWKKACKDYDVEIMTCEYLEHNNKQIAVKTALMFDTPFISCGVLYKEELKRNAKRGNRSKASTVSLEDETTEEDYVNNVKSSEETAAKRTRRKREVVDLEEEEEKPKRKRGKKTKSNDDDDVDEGPPEKQKRQQKKKKPKRQKDDEDDYDGDDEDQEGRKFSPKTVIIITLCAILGCIACFVTFGMFIDYQTGAKQNEITITNQRASLTTYAQKIIEEKGIKVTSCKSEIVQDKEFLYLGFTDIQQDVLNDLLQTLDVDCDVTQNNIVYGSDNTVSLELSITFK